MTVWEQWYILSIMKMNVTKVNKITVTVTIDEMWNNVTKTCWNDIREVSPDYFNRRIEDFKKIRNTLFADKNDDFYPNLISLFRASYSILLMGNNKHAQKFFEDDNVLREIIVIDNNDTQYIIKHENIEY